MGRSAIHYHWEFLLQSSPAALWPFVADTNRFNRDAGLPFVEPRDGLASRLPNARRRLHLAKLRGLFELDPTDAGGTRLTVQVWVTPCNLLGRLIIPWQAGFKASRAMKRIYPMYDRWAKTSAPVAMPDSSHVQFAIGGQQRLQLLKSSLLDQRAAAEIVHRLSELLMTADDIDLARMRPYALADAWHLERRAVLETFLLATRLGLLEFQWSILCPLCRGPADSVATLAQLNPKSHCETCNIDFEANFDRAVELTFRPSPAIRSFEARSFCVGSPQLTPHVIAQKLLSAGQTWSFNPTLEPGRYRLRALEQRGAQHLKVAAAPDARTSITLAATNEGWPSTEPLLSPAPTIDCRNATSNEQLFILERLAWTDQATTAADVILLQKFRDLFAAEALRPGEQISVGSIAILFTDLRASTEMYRRIGDAPAFGRVMSHFDVLKAAIAEEGGSIVKTIGDAVMAVFHQPQPALRAILRAQRALAHPAEGAAPLQLKAGLHYGPCIAVTLNDRLDYFGTTINVAARLVDLSTGNDIVISQAIHDDPLVADSLENGARSDSFQATLKGHDVPFTAYRIAPAAAR